MHEPSALRTDSAPAASSAAPASTQPFSGRVLNAYSGDELVYSKTLGDWRTHNGVDYACAEGSAVSAPCSGKVTETGTDGRWSSVVTLHPILHLKERVNYVRTFQVAQYSKNKGGG